jgi:hypothetical protein
VRGVLFLLDADRYRLVVSPINIFVTAIRKSDAKTSKIVLTTKDTKDTKKAFLEFKTLNPSSIFFVFSVPFVVDVSFI